MRIALVGKGGSGKTTVSALLARTLAARGFPVLAIDADINQHLARALGASPTEASTLPPLGLEIERIKDYLRGENPRIPESRLMIKTTPPGEGSRLLRLDEENPLFSYFSRMMNGVRVMAVGPFSEEDIGIKCYHGKTGAAELLLNHLLDREKEYVVVDMTAGADSFASGLFTRFDLTILVVEPTEKSVSVYEQYREYAKDHDVTIAVLGNKIEDAQDLAFLTERIGTNLLTPFSRSSFVKNSERGEFLPLAELEPENVRALDRVIAAIDAQKKNWVKFFRQATEFHRKNAMSWGNVATSTDLTLQIDQTFLDALSS